MNDLVHSRYFVTGGCHNSNYDSVPLSVPVIVNHQLSFYNNLTINVTPVTLHMLQQVDCCAADGYLNLTHHPLLQQQFHHGVMVPGVYQRGQFDADAYF